MIMVLALAFALFLFGLVAMVIDASYLYVWSARVQAAAQVAAQAGANSVDPHYLYGSSDHLVDLGPDGGLMVFQRGCVQVGDVSAAITSGAEQPQPPGAGVHCTSDGCRVFALVEATVHLPLPLFGDRVVVRGSSYAAPVVGAQSASATPCRPQTWSPTAPPTRP